MQSTTTAKGGGLLAPVGLSRGFALLPASGRVEGGSHRLWRWLPPYLP
jgi:hypothetical protein